MALFEHASHGNSRFGKLSSNMFFIRNTAQPKRVRHIEGLNGMLVCNVNDDLSAGESTSSRTLNVNPNNLPMLDSSRRVERLVPPMGFWSTHGIIHDTERWKQELASLATASGLGVEKDDQKPTNKSTTADSQHASRSGAHYSTRTGRFNEGTGKSRGRTGSKHGTANGDLLFNVPENEREMWMLQVLCQLLGTSNLEDVQSWLVSASPSEKDQARTMINAALCGLKESERTSADVPQAVDLQSLSHFVERQKHEEKYASQKFIQDSLDRSAPVLQSIDEEQQTTFDDPSDPVGSFAGDSSRLSLQNLTTYRQSYPNYYHPSHPRFTDASSKKKNASSADHEDIVDTIQLDDDRQRPQSASLPKTTKPSDKTAASRESPSSSQKVNHPAESLQFTDEDIFQQSQEIFTADNQAQHSSGQEDAMRARKIRDLQKKLARQEGDAKKLYDDLHSKQSRLENAIKLLVKQTSSYKKRREQIQDEIDPKDDGNAPVVNLIIQSPRGADHSARAKKNSPPGKPANGDSNDRTGKNRTDNRTPKVYSGVWKPDASVLQRLQGN